MNLYQKILLPAAGLPLWGGLVLGLFILTGCIREDRDDCLFPLTLHYTYTYNREECDLFAAEVDNVMLYLYDTDSGQLTASRRVETTDIASDGCTFDWAVPPGRYTLVSWGGIRSRNSVDGHGNIASHTAGLMLDQVEHRREHLWHDITTDILVNGDLMPVYDIDLHKLSNDLTVTVSSKGAPFASAPLSHVTASNGRYDSTGRPYAASPTLYLPAVDESDLQAVTYDYTLLSLSDGDDSHLHISLPDTGTTVYDGSLSSLLSADTAKDLDLDDEWHLDFDVDNGPDGNLAVSVSVNGWKIIDYTVILK